MDQIENMKTKVLFITLLLHLVSGCGVFIHKQQTYYVHEVNSRTPDKNLPSLIAQIVPTENNFHILFLIYSRKWIAPYSVLFSSRSEKKPDSYFLIHSFKVTAGDQVVTEETFDSPLKLKFEEKKYGNYVYYDIKYRYELGETLQFEEGKQIELEVTYEQPGVVGTKTIRLKGVGEEEKAKSSLWNAYMSV